ncbi:MAG: 3-oxoacyl-[acyl-carrier-protein] reductase [Flavobacteriales bacterium AspAUS03]
MKLLEGKTAIITGGTRGIGKAIVEIFAQEGAQVIFTYIKSTEKAQAIESELNPYAKVQGHQADATDAEAVQKLVEKTLEAFGGINIVVNNAGITRDNLLLRMTQGDWDKVIQTNLNSVFYLTRAVIKPMMKQRNGSIINMSSIVGVSGNAGQANYAASKAGIIGFTQSIAKELGSRNIRCNAIAPGFISTEMNTSLDSKILEGWLKGIPLKRAGTPEEIAKACLFLASDLSAYITGEVLNVNGGM